MQKNYTNIWFRGFLNDGIIFTLLKLTLTRPFPIWLLLLGRAPTVESDTHKR